MHVAFLERLIYGDNPTEGMLMLIVYVDICAGYVLSVHCWHKETGCSIRYPQPTGLVVPGYYPGIGIVLESQQSN